MRSRRMRVESQPPVIVRVTFRPTQDEADHMFKAMKPFGRRVMIVGPDSDVEWPAPPAQRQSRHAREIRVVHEFRKQVTPKVGFRPVGQR